MTIVGGRIPSAGLRPALLMVVAGALVTPPPGWASLGQDVASVEDDRAQMQGSRSIIAAENYTIHEIQAPTGTVVREFALPDGTVFAIAWQGPFIPNLRQLLSTYFEAFSQAAQTQKAHRPGHGPLLVQTPDLVVEAGGHMRAFFGRAYIPQLLPPKIDGGGIR
jgi:hypothetical protein